MFQTHYDASSVRNLVITRTIVMEKLMYVLNVPVTIMAKQPVVLISLNASTARVTILLYHVNVQYGKKRSTFRK